MEQEVPYEKSTAYLLAVVLVFLAAIIWTAVAILDFIYATSVFLRFLRVICAGMWWIAFSSICTAGAKAGKKIFES